VTVNASETLKAIAYETGWNNSNAVSAVYTINGAVANPTFSPVGGSYASTQNVTISTTTPGASIRYTTDGSTPTATTGTLYSGTVTVSASETLKAIAYETGWNNSNVVSALYTIGSAQTYTISGRVRIGGCPISAVNVALTGGGNPQTQTDTSGAYSFAVLTPGTYTVTPSKTGYTFTPTPAPFSLSGDLTKDFTASGPVVPPSREYIRLGGRVVAVANCGGQ
jgi:hypothetical protein